mmetsp:Transcript_56936/g.144425  ORF Transcript_56936/g.144425 Transcript_56936/m.144425 type:complete len:213 (+) Transcript_56936:898-1536(+)
MQCSGCQRSANGPRLTAGIHQVRVGGSCGVCHLRWSCFITDARRGRPGSLHATNCTTACGTAVAGYPLWCHSCCAGLRDRTPTVSSTGCGDAAFHAAAATPGTRTHRLGHAEGGHAADPSNTDWSPSGGGDADVSNGPRGGTSCSRFERRHVRGRSEIAFGHGSCFREPSGGRRLAASGAGGRDVAGAVQCPPASGMWIAEDLLSSCHGDSS